MDLHIDRPTLLRLSFLGMSSLGISEFHLQNELNEFRRMFLWTGLTSFGRRVADTSSFKRRNETSEVQAFR